MSEEEKSPQNDELVKDEIKNEIKAELMEELAQNTMMDDRKKSIKRILYPIITFVAGIFLGLIIGHQTSFHDHYSNLRYQQFQMQREHSFGFGGQQLPYQQPQN